MLVPCAFKAQLEYDGCLNHDDTVGMPMAWFKPMVFLIILLAMLLGHVCFWLTAKQRVDVPGDA